MFLSRRARRAAAVTTWAAGLALAAVGCGGSGSSTSTTAATAAGTTAAQAPAATTGGGPAMTIGYSDPLASEEGLRSVGYGEQQAIKQLGLNWTVKELDAKLSPDKQVSDIDSYIAQKVDGITVWTIDPGAAAAAFGRAKSASIPVVGLNSQSADFSSEIAADTDTTCRVSQQQAAYIAGLLPHATVLAIGGPPVPSITLTTNCFLKAAKHEGLQVLDTQNDTQSSTDSGQKVAAAMLVKNPDAQAVWAFSEGTALGAAASLKSAGKTISSGDSKGVVLVARNGTAAAAAAIKAGDLTATWDNNQPLVGAAAIQVLKYHLVDNVPLADLPKRVRIPSKRWDKSNIDTYQSPLSRDVPLPLPKTMQGS